MALTGFQPHFPGCLVLLCWTLVWTAVLGPVGSQGFVLPDGEQLGQLHDKRSFAGLRCRGAFDKGVFTELNIICDDCFNMYREYELHGLCRSDCFSSKYFEGCVRALQRTEELDKFMSYVQRTSGKK